MSVGKPKFYIYRKPHQTVEDRSVFCVYVNAKGQMSESWFSGPSDSINHADFKYIQNRWPNVRHAQQAKFVKRKYLEMMHDFKQTF